MHFTETYKALLWASILSSVVMAEECTIITICADGNLYEQDISECPGGIQIRDVDKWFSKSRDKTCICGTGAMLQFDGEAEPWFIDLFPFEADPEAGSWFDYNLTPDCELIKGNRSGALFINAKKYENPANFQTRALELRVEKFSPRRAAGLYMLNVASGHNRRPGVDRFKLLTEVILSTREPVLVMEDPTAQYKDFLCAYNATGDDFVLTKYVTASWGNQDLVKNCENQLYKPYIRTKYICPATCVPTSKLTNNQNQAEEEQTGNNGTDDHPLLAFRNLMLTMAEIAIRMKYANKYVVFTQDNHPYAAVLQSSCRVFHRAFPSVIGWETLMNAVNLFGIAFEGLVPMTMDKSLFDQMKIMLGRCSIQEMRRQKEHNKLVDELCPSSAQNGSHFEFRRSAAHESSKREQKAKRQGQQQQQNSEQQGNSQIGYGGPHNVVVEVLWKMVQFVHASCLSSVDHYPNIHHAYTSAMIEMFSAPPVQLLWYQQGVKEFQPLAKAMIHIFPELPENVIPTIEQLFAKIKFHTHFNVLIRPKIRDLENRDMRCAGHGKLIWGGKACCYQESDDKKFRYFNKVTYAKL